MPDMTPSDGQRLYVIASAGGMRLSARPKGAYRTAGHEGVPLDCLSRDHARQIAQRRDRPDPMPAADDDGSLAGDGKYLAAMRARGPSAHGNGVGLDSGMDLRPARVLETCRQASRKVRLVLGDTGTGANWLDEFDVACTVGRSTGQLNVRLLVEPGEARDTPVPDAGIGNRERGAQRAVRD